MGVVQNVGFCEFPKQGVDLGTRVSVLFRYDTDNKIGGTCVRDDIEEPFRTIFQLDDGRYVLATECQYAPEPQPPEEK